MKPPTVITKVIQLWSNAQDVIIWSFAKVHQPTFPVYIPLITELTTIHHAPPQQHLRSAQMRCLRVAWMRCVRVAWMRGASRQAALKRIACATLSGPV